MRLPMFLITGAAVVCLSVIAGPAPARAADGNAQWVSAPAQPPPTPPGAQPSPYPLPLGYVGDIEFWAPNRGLLITAGDGSTDRSGPVPPGVYAYDGLSWHELSTVCGGSDGRIAWAGADEFWTISDQRPGQANIQSTDLANVSLCHFDNGQVVGSYAMLVGTPNSYPPMFAAACDASADCWFGGVNDGHRGGGAFHLHWDGSNVSVVDGSAGHTVASMTVHNGQIYESVTLTDSDTYQSSTPTAEPLVHRIIPTDAADPFHNAPFTCGCNATLPQYSAADASSNAVDPASLNGLALSSDWRTGVAHPQLWAAAGPSGSSGNGAAANPLFLRYADPTGSGQPPVWTQLSPIDNLGNDQPVLDERDTTAASESVAAEPNEPAAWIAMSRSDGQAQVDRVQADPSSTNANDDGLTHAAVTNRAVLGDAQGVGPRGAASAVACPADHDCWLATDQGWLFHLTDGTQLPQDTEPNFAGIISSRPADGGIVAGQPVGTIVPTSVPPPPPVQPIPVPKTTKPRRRTPLVTHLGRSHVVHRTTLEISFTLSARARVRLVAKRHRRIVAETKLLVLKPGRHTVTLKLDPRHWPTALALNANPVSAAKTT